MVLSDTQVETFIRDGAVKLEQAFSRETAAACQEILWRDLKLSTDHPEDRKRPRYRTHHPPPTIPIFLMPSRWAAAITWASTPYSASGSAWMWSSA